MIELRNVEIAVDRHFGLHDMNLVVAENEYVVLMGRTGCGKTTLLEAICGLRTIVGGSIHLGGQDVTDLPPRSRNIGYVPQDLALFDTMTVSDHLRMGPQLRGAARSAIQSRVDELLTDLHIDHLRNRYPNRLSGGERQRVALGRALAGWPKLLLLDEPLSALDDDTHDEIVRLLANVHQRHPITVLHVTHRMQEAVQLADRMLRLEEGKIVSIESRASETPQDASRSSEQPAPDR